MAMISSSTAHGDAPAPPLVGEPAADRRALQRPRPDDVPTAGVVDAEQRLIRQLLISTAVAIPVLVAFWVAVVALAVSFTDAAFVPALLMGGAVGVLAGVFWGTWMGFVSYSRAVEAERRAGRAPGRTAAPERN